MDKITSAEEFAIGVFVKIYGFELNWIRTLDGKNGREAAIRFVRSRDKAIVGRIRDRAYGNLCDSHDRQLIIDICDDILREIGGEQ